MRWTDLPPDGRRDDAGPSGLRRSEWEQLRQRLERLPAGHPSSPGGERRGGDTGDDDGWDDDSRLKPDAQEGWDTGRERAGGQASEPSGAGDPDVARGTGGAGRHARRGRNDDRADRRAGRDDGSPSGATDAIAAGPARREPYRPWFASAESAEPWFASGSQPGLIPPGRDRG